MNRSPCILFIFIIFFVLIFTMGCDRQPNPPLTGQDKINALYQYNWRVKEVHYQQGNAFSVITVPDTTHYVFKFFRNGQMAGKAFCSHCCNLCQGDIILQPPDSLLLSAVCTEVACDNIGFFACMISGKKRFEIQNEELILYSNSLIYYYTPGWVVLEKTDLTPLP